ncbi:MAG TPA: methylated-DNA--[protein]-cysteine S-methyltransferase [Pseudolysinimonas sp.]|jgi:methylated-DNA-[protein]-cysteine S-methyltransferase|nr:methylated-DNA--[protein]-cysteine S-methyltransferase [Pseudolysinimonas sp.]
MSDSRESVSAVRSTLDTMQTTVTAPEHLRRMASPIGRLEIIGNGEAITSLSIERDGTLPHDEFPEQTDEVLERAVEQLQQYFAGHRHDFDLPLSLAGTAFQLAVWEQLVDLEFGEVVSYGELGLATGRPTAGRAVGGAVGANPIPIIVPCHRVLGSDGRITGYSGGEGIPTKAWLLEHEGVEHNTPASRLQGQTALDMPAA